VTSKPWPYNHIRDPRPADWGAGMTVCIAAHSAPDTIVCVTDMKMSMSDNSMSGDATALKMAYFGKNWICLMAGNLSPFPDIRRHFAEFAEKNDISFPMDEYHIVDGFKYAFEKELKRRSEAEILAPYGLTFENYRDEGPKLGADAYSRIIFDLRNKDLGLHLMLAGFDQRKGHILVIDKSGLAEHYEGFWAIGSGDLAALGYLLSSEMHPVSSSPATVFYRACFAKFAAETSPGVGERTIVCVLKKDGSSHIFRDDRLTEIRKEWDRLKNRTVSATQIRYINGLIASIKPENPDSELNEE
jgi:hypothetical protein